MCSAGRTLRSGRVALLQHSNVQHVTFEDNDTTSEQKYNVIHVHEKVLFYFTVWLSTVNKMHIHNVYMYRMYKTAIQCA